MKEKKKGKANAIESKNSFRYFEVITHRVGEHSSLNYEIGGAVQRLLGAYKYNNIRLRITTIDGIFVHAAHHHGVMGERKELGCSLVGPYNYYIMFMYMITLH